MQNRDGEILQFRRFVQYSDLREIVRLPLLINRQDQKKDCASDNNHFWMGALPKCQPEDFFLKRTPLTTPEMVLRPSLCASAPMMDEHSTGAQKLTKPHPSSKENEGVENVRRPQRNMANFEAASLEERLDLFDATD